jgi:hypothetical protein
MFLFGSKRYAAEVVLLIVAPLGQYYVERHNPCRISYRAMLMLWVEWAI